MEGLGKLLVYTFVSCIIKTCIGGDTIEPSQVIRDGGETLVSADGIYEMGFFSPTKLSSRYLGIWYKNVTPQTVVWVANRENPLLGISGAVNFTSQGLLMLLNSSNGIVWSSRSSTLRHVHDPIAQLLDSGNFVVRGRNDHDPDEYLWQSFDFICDTLLPEMKIGTNFVTGLEWFLSSWKSTEDPSPGSFSLHIDTNGYPQMVVKERSRIMFRAGSWNGKTWTGSPLVHATSAFAHEFQFNDKEVYYKYEVPNGSALTKLAIYPSGLVQRYTWDNRSQEWTIDLTGQIDRCENYALCGAYGSCNSSMSPICGCLDGFIPKLPSKWSLGNWSDGCTRRTSLACGGDKFLMHSDVKLPDTSNSWYNSSMSLKDCERFCLNNCSCTAYANLDVRGTGCLFWFNDLIDIRTFMEGGQDIYVRLAASELDGSGQIRPSKKRKQIGIIVGSVAVVISMILFAVGIMIHVCRKRIRKAAMEHQISLGIGSMEEEMDMPIFDMIIIAAATNNFSDSNKLGEGGFGPVYKGTLLEGQEIAVKKLSKSSGQGLKEFKTEVMLIAKLQHRNLVRLLGCCLHGDEKMLIYEYMPNKSLDSFIFDKTRSKLLDWPKRMCIIGGVARGLMYLHLDSRLRIIHRDLKASNILLDANMNPKISDFGLARMFGADQTEANTRTVVGTYGYMAPEYAVDGRFSMKSDVFSFGVLVLEIVSGKKNRGFNHPNHDLNLLGHAWMLWTEGEQLELVDDCLRESCNPSEVTRCIHVALLCVQQRPESRPTMSSVVQMLGGENLFSDPKQPGYFMGRNPHEAKADSSSCKNSTQSANDCTITGLEPR